jgi:hypothetical protein
MPQHFVDGECWNMHASAVSIGNYCIVISGPAGSGKTHMCRALCERFSAEWIADDRLLLRLLANGGIELRAHERLLGLVMGPHNEPLEVQMLPEKVTDVGRLLWIELGNIEAFVEADLTVGHHSIAHLKLPHKATDEALTYLERYWKGWTGRIMGA